MHSRLGQLVKDGDFPWWLSRLNLGGASVEISIKSNSGLSQSVLDGAAHLFEWLQTQERQFREQVAADIKTHDGNAVVLSDAVDVGSYMQRMTLERVSYSEDGRFQLSYDDGGLFGGHLMTGYFTPSGQLESTEIAG